MWGFTPMHKYLIMSFQRNSVVYMGKISPNQFCTIIKKESTGSLRHSPNQIKAKQQNGVYTRFFIADS